MRKAMSRFLQLYMHKKIWHKIFVSLAAVVVFTTTYMLILPAITQEAKTYCGEEAHEHSDDCYTVEKTLTCGKEESEGHTHTDSCYKTEKVLVCTSTEEGHEHTDECYKENKTLICDKEESKGHKHTASCYKEKKVLTCGKKEHTHTLECFSNPKADVESRSDWEGSLKNVKLTGVWADDVLTVAKSQLGYKESTQNYEVGKDGKTKNGYTRYGAWYGNKYGDWCAMYVSFCLNYAGVDTDVMPEEAGCQAWVEKLNSKKTPYYYAVNDKNDYKLINGKDSVCYNKESEEKEECKLYHPQAGDLIFFNWDKEADADHVGIITKVEYDKNGKITKIDTIEGNSSDMVRENEYEPDDSNIMGFAKLPENPKLKDGKAAETTEVTTEATTENTEVSTEETTEAVEETTEVTEDQTTGGTYTYEDDTISVTAEVGEDSEIPSDAEFKVVPVTAETEGYNYEAYMAALNQQKGGQEGLAETQTDGVEPKDSSEEYTSDNTLLYDIAFLGKEENEDGIERTVEYQPKEGSVKLTFVYKDKQLSDIKEKGEEISVIHLPLSDDVKESYATTSEAVNIQARDIEPELLKASIDTKDEKEDTATFEMKNFSIVATSGLATQATNTNKSIAVNSERDLLNVNGKTVYLNADITTNSTINITGNTTIDLNGHKIITTSSPLFNVTGGSLTIVDSATPTYTTEEVTTLTKDSSEDNYGKKATYSNGTLTYYVTMPDTDGCETGVTKDTLVKYTVSNVGMIVGNTTQTDKDCQAIKVSGGTVNLNGGYICNFTSASGGAAVNATGGTVSVNGSVLAGNTTSAAKGGGAISVTNATLKIEKGIITGNSNTSTGDKSGGGGIYAGGSSKVTLSDGYITNNSLTGSSWNSRGGGIMMDGTASLTMNGGYVTGNEADQGGGGIGTMYNDASPTITINGGYISSNLAKNHEGGGVALLAGNLTISGDKATYITNNRTESSSDWGGGGVFVAENANGYIYKALITSNTAGGFGGGVAGCSTGHIYTSTEGKDGAAIFNNSADGKHLSGNDSSKSEDHVYANGNTTFMTSGYEDAFCQHNSVVSGGMLSGTEVAGTENWTGSIDGSKITSTSNEDLLSASNTMGLTANPNNGDIANATSAAKVYISGNDSYTHGGGVLTNGFTFFGTTGDVTFPAGMQIIGRKYYYDQNHNELDLEDKQFTFYVYDENDNIVATGTNDTKHKITFDNSLNFAEAGTYTFTIREANDPDADKDGIIRDTTIYKLTITTEVVKNDSLSTSTMTVSEVKVTNVKVQKKNGDSGTYSDVTSSNNIINNNHLVDISDIFTSDFTNYKSNNVTVNVEKKWTTTNHPSSVTVHLLRNGENVKDSDTVKGTVTLDSSNNWKYTWTGLLSMGTDSSGKSVNYTYTVKEDAVDGYSAGIEYDNTATGKTRNYWVRVSGNEEIVPGEKYVIVSDDNKNVVTTYSWPSNQENMSSANTLTGITKAKPVKALNDQNVTSSDWYEDGTFNDYNIFTGYEYGDYITLVNSKKRQYFTGYWDNWKYMQNTNQNSNSFSARVYGGYLQFGLTHLYDNPSSSQTFGYLTTKSDNQYWTLSTKSDSTNNFKVYKLVTAYDEVSLTQNITITNGETDKLLYKLDITKESSEKDAKGNTIVLPNADFEIINTSNEKLYFTHDTDGYYTYASSATAGATTTLTSNANGEILIRDIPHGTYVLHESKAPEGYDKAADKTIYLNPGNTSVKNKKLSVTITDSPEGTSFELPETGGFGTTLYTMGGLLLLGSALGIGTFRWRRRERRFRV